jgi:hypothetical protein
MQTILGHAVFDVPSQLRDETTYMFSSEDDSRMLRVTPMPGAKDPGRALASAKAAFEDFMGDMIVYLQPHPVADRAGVFRQAFEGEGKDPSGSGTNRFGLVALSEGDNTVVLLYLAPRSAFVSEFQRVVRSVHFLANVLAPAFVTTTGLARRQAGCASVEVPPDWSYPTNLIFGNPEADDLTLRVTLDDPPAQEGGIALEKELPAVSGDRVIVTHQAIVRGRPNAQSWVGEWTVDHVSRIARHTVLVRKAYIPQRAGRPLTMHGKAWEANAARLTAAWEIVLQTIRERP